MTPGGRVASGTGPDRSEEDADAREDGPARDDVGDESDAGNADTPVNVLSYP